MYKKISSLLLALTLCTAVFAGCGDTKAKSTSDNNGNITTQTVTTNSVPGTTEKPDDKTTAKKPKYIFAFIGDGMSHVQINAAKVYRGNNTSGEVNPGSLNFTTFPVAGIATTHDSTSFCPDSASTATSIATGVKTHSGVIGMEVYKTTVAENISETLSSEKGMKIGIISSVTINHATPAAFYSHVPSRNEYYDIAMQMANSNFDYFAGGTISSNTGKDGTDKDVFEVLTEKGYTIADTAEEINALNSNSGKVYAVSPVLQDSGAMPYTLDSDESTVTLEDFVDKGIEVLDNENGFFLMCESGKIDWACHANDAMSAITDVLGFESAIQSAVDFAKLHPDETLIIVTGDHETGGMTIGYAATGYDTAFSLLGEQKMSYVAFDEKISEMKTENPNLKLEEVMPLIKENFGLMLSTDPDATDEKNAAFVLSESEYQKLKNGFAESMKSGENRTNDETTALLYGGYDPLSVSLTHIINNKAGIGWTSYAHTGTPVPVYAMGAYSELFSGSYDNTDIHDKLLEAVGL
jgi:alkaline phosphatase